MTKARLGLVIPKTNEKRSGSIVGKELDPPAPPQKKKGAAAVEL